MTTRDNARSRAYREHQKAGASVTCHASRHAYRIAETLWKGQKYPMLDEEPQYCAESFFAVVTALWKARRRIAELEKR